MQQNRSRLLSYADILIILSVIIRSFPTHWSNVYQCYHPGVFSSPKSRFKAEF